MRGFVLLILKLRQELDGVLLPVNSKLRLLENKTEDPSVPAAGIGNNYVKVRPKKCQGKRVQGTKRVVGSKKVFRDP